MSFGLIFYFSEPSKERSYGEVRDEFLEYQTIFCILEGSVNRNYYSICELKYDDSENRVCYKTLYQSSFRIPCLVFDDARKIWDNIDKTKKVKQ